MNTQDKNKFTLAVVILNYRTVELTASTIDAVLPELDRENHVVVVVDNFSNDGSLEYLERIIKARDSYCIKLIENERNAGFSAGVNIGIRSIDASCYLLLNSDAYPRKSAIRKLVGCSMDNPLSIIYPTLQFPDGVPQRNYFKDHSYLSELIDAAQTNLVTACLKRWDVSSVNKDVGDVDWVSFACVLIPKSVFELCGFLDEGFFLYYEDAEFCRRARLKGITFVHAPGVNFVHLRGQSATVKSDISSRRRLPMYYYQSRSYYFRKRNGRLGLFLANLCWYMGRCVSLLRELVRNKLPHLPPFAHRDIWNEY